MLEDFIVRSLLLACLMELNDGLISLDLIVIRFLGDWNDSYDLYANKLGLSNALDVRGRVEYDECMRLLCASSVNVLINRELDRDVYNVPSKLGDYLLASRPILALTKKNSATYKLILDEQLGSVAESGDIENIASEIVTIYEKWREDGAVVIRNDSLVAKYDIHSVMSLYNQRLSTLLR